MISVVFGLGIPISVLLICKRHPTYLQSPTCQPCQPRFHPKRPSLQFSWSCHNLPSLVLSPHPPILVLSRSLDFPNTVNPSVFRSLVPPRITNFFRAHRLLDHASHILCRWVRLCLFAHLNYRPILSATSEEAWEGSPDSETLKRCLPNNDRIVLVIMNLILHQMPRRELHSAKPISPSHAAPS